MVRAVLGFILAPAAPLLPALVYALFAGLRVLGPAVFVASFYAYPLALIFGVPGYLVFRRFGWLGWRHVVLASAIIGCMPFAYIVAVSAFDRDGQHTSAFILLPYGLGLGVLCGITFWFVAEFRRGTSQG